MRTILKNPPLLFFCLRNTIRPMTAIAIIKRDEIIERVARGEYLASIAASLNLAGKGQAISNALASDPDYQAARERGLEAKLANREAQLERAEKDDVPRARELLSHARWRAERECPQRWAPRSQVAVTSTVVHLDGVLGARIGRVLDALPNNDASAIDDCNGTGEDERA